jgi:hypothetical protein
MKRCVAAFSIDLDKYQIIIKKPKTKENRYTIDETDDIGLWEVTGPTFKIVSESTNRSIAMVPVKCTGFDGNNCNTHTAIQHRRLISGGSKACAKCAGKYRKHNQDQVDS